MKDDVDAVDCQVDCRGIADIAVDDVNAIGNGREPSRVACRQIVENDDCPSLFQEPVDEVVADEPGSTCD